MVIQLEPSAGIARRLAKVLDTALLTNAVADDVLLLIVDGFKRRDL